MKNLLRLLTILLIPVLFSCEPNITDPQGTGDLGTLVPAGEKLVYVAIGNSLTAGYQSGAVFTDGQQYSFPNLIAHQLGCEEFNQPEYDGNGTGDRIYFHGFNATGSPIITKSMNIANVLNVTLAKPYNNLGVPGAIAYDLLDESDFMQRSSDRSNPFYASVLRSSALGKSMVDQAIALNPNLITLWMGNNDVLGYATSGGTISTTYVSGKAIPTPSEAIGQILGGAMYKLTASLPNCKILMCNIPNVLGAPFFKVIPWNALVVDAQTAAALNFAYQQLGFSFKEGANGFVCESPSSPGGMRQMTSEDYLLFSCPQDSLKAGWGSMKPIPNQYVLDKFEAAVVLQAINDYNVIIGGMTNVSTTDNLYLVNTNQIFADILTNGYKVPGATTLKNSYISGGMFSFDGIHPSSKGYGALANELLKFINSTFNADIPLYPIQNLPTNQVTAGNY